MSASGFWSHYASTVLLFLVLVTRVRHISGASNPKFAAMLQTVYNLYFGALILLIFMAKSFFCCIPKICWCIFDSNLSHQFKVALEFSLFFCHKFSCISLKSYFKECFVFKMESYAIFLGGWYSIVALPPTADWVGAETERILFLWWGCIYGHIWSENFRVYCLRMYIKTKVLRHFQTLCIYSVWAFIVYRQFI